MNSSQDRQNRSHCSSDMYLTSTSSFPFHGVQNSTGEELLLKDEYQMVGPDDAIDDDDLP